MKFQGKITQALEQTGIDRKTMPILFVIADQIRGNEDGRAAVAYRVIAEEFGFYDRRVRTAIKQAIECGILKADTKTRRYTMVSLTPLGRRLFGSQNGSQNGAENYSRNSIKSIERDSQNGSQSGATGVSGSYGVVAVDLDVSHSGVDIDKKQPAPETAARKPIKEKPKIPGRKELGDHIVKTWEAKARVKFPNDKAGWVQLDELLARFSSDALAALWDRYLCSGDPFVAKQGYKLRFFSAAVDGIALTDLTYKRDAARYFARWYEGATVEIQPEPDNRPAQPAPRDVLAPREKPIETDIPQTAEELAAMHRETVRTLGPRACRNKDCDVCRPAAVDLELEALPV